MNALFEPGSITTLSLKNRLIRSATWEGMCDPDGRPTQKLADYYQELVRGGIGLIISGYTYVSPEGKQLPGKMGIYTDDFQEDFKHLTSAVHGLGGKIAVQLVHAGGQASSKVSGFPTCAPSPVQAAQFSELPRALTLQEIQDLVQAFGQAAKRAKAWGFDGVQIHGAHGYLVNQFLSPLTNQRTDEYGGSLENRSRFLKEIFQEIRSQVGKNYPVFIKLNGDDHLDGGFGRQDALILAAQLSDMGMDAIEVSSGTPASGKQNPARAKINEPEKEAYNLELAMAIQQKVSCPMICVGGFRSKEISQTAVTTHGMDFIALSRPLIREPNLPKLWEKNEAYTAACISCNSCFKPGLTQGGIYCVVEKKAQKA